MAHLLGSQFCLDSLHNDVLDVQAAVMEVFSRVGPVRYPSWKFPDKISCDINIEELLERFQYSEDQEDQEDNQVAHIMLFELVIDRLMLLMQSCSRFADVMLNAGQSRPQTAAGLSSSLSLGLVIKKYWNKMVQLCTMLQQLQSENKTKDRKIAKYEAALSKQQRQNAVKDLSASTVFSTSELSLSDLSLHDTTGTSKGGLSSTSPPLDFARDVGTKACQTLETAFVPCEACFRVQQNLVDVGNNVINVCQTQGLPSSLKTYKAQQHLETEMSAADVSRWTAEQNKDMQRINKHLENLMSQINPLKEEVAAAEREKAKLQKRIDGFDGELRREQEVQRAELRQKEERMKRVEEASTESLARMENINKELSAGKKELEERVDRMRVELDGQEHTIKELEVMKSTLLLELKDGLANKSEVEQVQDQLQQVQEQLQQVQTKLSDTEKEYNKEQAKNRSLAKHDQSMQAKHDSLIQRLDELDQECEELRTAVSEQDEGQEGLREELDKAQADRTRAQEQLQAQKELMESLNKEKSSLQDLLQTLEGSVDQMKQQLQEAQEREKLLVQYPDLHGPPSSHVTESTGDILTDMERQLTANNIRIQVLQDQNQSLRNSIAKLKQAQPATGHSTRLTEPVTLWKSQSLNGLEQTPRRGSASPQTPPRAAEWDTPAPAPLRTSLSNPDLSDSDKRPLSAYRTRRYSPALDDTISTLGLPPRPPGKTSSGSNRRVGSAGSTGGGGNVAAHSTAVSAIDVYKKMKQAGVFAPQKNMDLDMRESFTIGRGAPVKGQAKGRRPGSGGKGRKSETNKRPVSRESPHDYHRMDTFVCEGCDKMYTSAKELEIHKSYCYGGI
ncbi:PREDICTED: coiled-coil domain-containing protein 157-like [Branchiostoma belcheri]|uniref:Coiled-coil domain-containing protein 157-like n=1 Tax=Branchiostoma belcheri TaxID=7741 RepID=A0A6P4ZNL5_BRABE|nr:PREDICTED: coiled-coil domain-containing protein 157-like [Branchiostoma belcheri]